MAIPAYPIIQGKGLLDLLRETVPPQEQALELYGRLLAINELATSMNAAKDVDQLHGSLAASFREWMPQESVCLCVKNGGSYRRFRLSGPADLVKEDVFPLDTGVTGIVLSSGTPLWLPDAHDIAGWLCSDGSSQGSAVILPFTVLGKVAGALELISARPGRFDELEYHLGFLVAAHLSSSLENVLTRQELATANARLRDHDLRLRQLNHQLQQLAHTDDLTGLFNKRRLLEQLDAEIARARRYGEIMSCLMLDLDDFKLINDQHGHPAGDEVLRQVGQLLKRSLRVTDFVARYGGEEFTVLLPRTDSAGAYRTAEKLRLKFKQQAFAIPAGEVTITVSIGIACCTKFDHLESQQVILLADGALYRAKRSGRDRVCFSEMAESDAATVNILATG